MTRADQAVGERLAALGLVVFERGWLSSNNVLALPPGGGPATVVDTGYSAHAPLTARLIERQLAGRPLERVVNTHLHSDHCGGNALLARTFGAQIWIPSASFDAVARWDAHRLTFELTDQHCEPFSAQRAIEVGEVFSLGGRPWRAIAAPGHDPDALMFFQPESRVLIAGDALWQDRVAIIFPELAGEAGFDAALGALDTIERLAPAVVIPGHGPAFSDVAAALASSRERLLGFARAPLRHLGYAVRALAMFHMLEHRRRSRDELVHWMIETPVLAGGLRAFALDRSQALDLADESVARLVRDGALLESNAQIWLPAVPSEV